jgi:hypothetical protein
LLGRGDALIHYSPYRLVGYGRARGYGRQEIIRFIPTIGARIVHVYQFEVL